MTTKKKSNKKENNSQNNKIKMTMKFSVVSFLWKLSACDIQKNTQITVPICPAAMTMTSRIMSDA